MTIEELKKLIQTGEKRDVEFKQSQNDITKDVYSTVCSFNNSLQIKSQAEIYEL